MGATDRLRARTADGTIARSTDAQYRILRYWAGNTADRPERGGDLRPWTDRNGPAPRLQQRTVELLTTRGWWFLTDRGWYVTDNGRRAGGMPPAHRDRPCPLVECSARPGERCRRIGVSGPVYTDLVHDARTALHPVYRQQLRGRTGGGQAGRFPGQPGRHAGGTPYLPGDDAPKVSHAQVMAALVSCAPHLASRVASPHEPRHIGIVTAT